MKYDFNSSNFNNYFKTGDLRSFEHKNICCFCGRKFTGYGNNPVPLKSSVYTCCDKCNRELVIPARLKNR